MGIGFNSGYVPDGHDGANNALLLVEAKYDLTERLGLIGLVGYSLAINSYADEYPGDETLKDTFWGGVGLTFAF